MVFAPRAPLTNFNDGGGGGSDRGSYFIPKKITTSEFVYPKKSQLFFANPKNSLYFSLRPKTFPASFIDPKKSLWAKISDPRKSLGPPVIKICEGGPWGFCIRGRHQGNGASSGFAFKRRASFALTCPFDLAWLLSDSILKFSHPVTKLEPEFDRLGTGHFLSVGCGFWGEIRKFSSLKGGGGIPKVEGGRSFLQVNVLV